MFLMTSQDTKHEVHEHNVAFIGEVIASDYVPATVSIVAFSTLADIESKLDFQADALSVVVGLVDQIGVSLIVVVFIR